MTIATNHQLLQWLFKLKIPVGQMARWALRIQGLTMNIIYAPGRLNVISDSRPVCPEDNSQRLNLGSIEMLNLNAEDLRRKQLANEELERIISDQGGEDPVQLGRWMERGYCITNGVLYFLDDDHEEPRLVVPPSIR